jgi:hypothetical protein
MQTDLRYWMTLVERGDTLDPAVLRERRIEVRGSTFPLLQNPTIQQLLAVLRGSTWDRLKGLAVDNDVYWWDAYYAHHGDIAQIMVYSDNPEVGYWDNPNYDNDARMILDLECEHTPTLDCNDKMLCHPRMVKLLASDEIAFSVPGAGCMNYSQYKAFRDNVKDWWKAARVAD